MPNTITWGEAPNQYTIPDISALPEVSLVALVASGLAHKLGNEVASEIVSEIRKTIRDESEDSKKEVSRDEISEWRTANAEKVAAMTKAARDETFKEILDGTISARAPGAPRAPKLSEHETIVRELAWDTVQAVLVAKNPQCKLVNGKFTYFGKGITKDTVLVTLGGVGMTKGMLIDRQLGKDGVRAKYEKAATKRLEEKRRLASAPSAESASLEDLL